MQSFSLFWTWWVGQLAALLPTDLTGGSQALLDALILERDPQTLSLVVRRRGQEQCLAQTRGGDSAIRELENVLRTRKDLPHRFLIRLPSAHLLRKSLALPAAARRNLADILSFEIDRETPFQRDEVHWTYLVRGQDTRTGMLDVELILQPHASVDPLVAAMRSLGMEPAGIEVEAAGGVTTFIPLGARPRGQWLDAQRPLLPLAAVAAVLALLATGAPFVMQQWDLAAVEARIAALEPAAIEVATIRQQAGQVAATIDFLTKERGKSGNALAALAAATNTLPDDSYLSTLSLRAGRLMLNGMAPSAAQLIGTLAEVPEFREPSFEAPVTRDADSELESFTISVVLAPAVGAP